MPSYMVRTPNGTMAVFSSIVEDFTTYSIQPDEMETAARRSVPGYEGKFMRDALDDRPFLNGPQKHTDGLGRWREALEMMALNKTRAQVRESLSGVGFPDYDFEAIAKHWPYEDELLLQGSER